MLSDISAIDLARFRQLSGVRGIIRVPELGQENWYHLVRHAGGASFVRRAVNFLSVPDLHWIWARRAVRAARQLMCTQPIDVVLTSSAPYAVHLAGLRLRRLGPAQDLAEEASALRDPAQDHAHGR